MKLALGVGWREEGRSLWPVGQVVQPEKKGNSRFSERLHLKMTWWKVSRMLNIPLWPLHTPTDMLLHVHTYIAHTYARSHECTYVHPRVMDKDYNVKRHHNQMYA